jgi:glycosyltransferase involved in cell wall biosynthesis
MDGFVEDVRPELAAASCFVVPLRVGGGTRLKILEAWAMGAPVVSTSVGCEGLKAEHDRNILLADTPEEFAAAVTRVVTDDELAARLGASGRATAVLEYDWSILARVLCAQYKGLVRRP